MVEIFKAVKRVDVEKMAGLKKVEMQVKKELKESV